MNDFRLSVEADEDLVSIFLQGCDRFGPRQADRYIDDLWGAFARIGANPEVARLRLEIDPPLRVFVHKAHIVIYEIDDKGVVILRIRHGHEDWQVDPVGKRQETR